MVWKSTEALSKAYEEELIISLTKDMADSIARLFVSIKVNAPVNCVDAGDAFVLAAALSGTDAFRGRSFETIIAESLDICNEYWKSVERLDGVVDALSAAIYEAWAV